MVYEKEGWSVADSHLHMHHAMSGTDIEYWMDLELWRVLRDAGAPVQDLHLLHAEGIFKIEHLPPQRRE